MSNSSLTNLIKIEDLQNLHHAVILKNDTSGTSLIDTQSIEIMEFFMKGVALRLPPNHCAENHNLGLYFLPLPLEKKVTTFEDAEKVTGAFHVLGKIKEIFRPENNRLNWTIVVELTQYHVEDWEALVSLYIDKQDQITDLKP